MYLEAADPMGSKWFWTGLTDLFSEGTFVWMPSGKEATYFNWSHNEPNNANGIEHFVNIHVNRTWNDCSILCNDYALCQKEL